jgi:hypothetical protein
MWKSHPFVHVSEVLAVNGCVDKILIEKTVIQIDVKVKPDSFW